MGWPGCWTTIVGTGVAGLWTVLVGTVLGLFLRNFDHELKKISTRKRTLSSWSTRTDKPHDDAARRGHIPTTTWGM